MLKLPALLMLLIYELRAAQKRQKLVDLENTVNCVYNWGFICKIGLDIAENEPSKVSWHQGVLNSNVREHQECIEVPAVADWVGCDVVVVRLAWLLSRCSLAREAFFLSYSQAVLALRLISAVKSEYFWTRRGLMGSCLSVPPLR